MHGTAVRAGNFSSVEDVAFLYIGMLSLSIACVILRCKDFLTNVVSCKWYLLAVDTSYLLIVIRLYQSKTIGAVLKDSIYSRSKHQHDSLSARFTQWKVNKTTSVSAISTPADTFTVFVDSAPLGFASLVSKLCPPHVKPLASSAWLSIVSVRYSRFSLKLNTTYPIASLLITMVLGADPLPLNAKVTFLELLAPVLVDRNASELIRTARLRFPPSKNA